MQNTSSQCTANEARQQIEGLRKRVEELTERTETAETQRRHALRRTDKAERRAAAAVAAVGLEPAQLAKMLRDARHSDSLAPPSLAPSEPPAPIQPVHPENAGFVEGRLLPYAVCDLVNSFQPGAFCAEKGTVERTVESVVAHGALANSISDATCLPPQPKSFCTVADGVRFRDE